MKNNVSDNLKVKGDKSMKSVNEKSKKSANSASDCKKDSAKNSSKEKTSSVKSDFSMNTFPVDGLVQGCGGHKDQF